MKTVRGWELPQLQRVRRAGFMTQSTLAEKSGISQQTISGLEKGGRGANLETVERLARALGVEPTELSGGNDAR